MTSTEKITERLNEVKRDLVLLKQAIRNVYEAGTSLGVSGGISYSSATLTDLRKEELTLLKEKLKLEVKLLGFTPNITGTRTYSDFSEDGGSGPLPV
jgi:hypothetical protein